VPQPAKPFEAWRWCSVSDAFAVRRHEAKTRRFQLLFSGDSHPFLGLQLVALGSVPCMYKTSLLALGLVLALVASACSNDSGTEDVASIESKAIDTSQQADSDPVADTEKAMLAFTQCLRDQGLDVDDPTMDADGNMQLAPISFESVVPEGDTEPEMPDFESLVAPCEEHLDGIVATAGAGAPAELEDALLAYAQCMRANGVDMPDPDLTSGGMIDLGGGVGDDFEAADKVCRPHLAGLGIQGG
jgi:hypothetical protein